MSTDLTKSPDYEVLCERLLEKTVAKKLNWQESAAEDTFFAAVKGVQTFLIGMSTVRSEKNGITSFDNDPRYWISVKDHGGHEIIAWATEDPNSNLAELFKLVKRITARIDEKIESSLELLNQL